MDEVLLADVGELGDGRPIIDKPVVSAVLDETGVLNMTAVTAEERGGEGEQCNTELSRFLLKVKTGSKNYWCRGGGCSSCFLK